MGYKPSGQRYGSGMRYRRCGASGLRLPEISLGLWNNFGGTAPSSKAREMIRTAFDRGITHFDLANNYGPPPGSAESNFGRILREDLSGYRDELIISTKAGYLMWDGPYGEWGSRKYVLASLDQSLQRLGLDYVDIFYSHRFDPNTPLEETMQALASAVQQGKALYVGISSYSAQKTAQAVQLLQQMGVRCLIHQPSYSLLNRWIEPKLLPKLEKLAVGCIAFSPLAQGLLSDRYLRDIPLDSRARTAKHFMRPEFISDDNLKRVRTLNKIAEKRGQTLAQMALVWCLRDPRITSVLIGASRPEQLHENIAGLDTPEFSSAELQEIDLHATEGNLNLWAESSQY